MDNGGMGQGGTAVQCTSGTPRTGPWQPNPNPNPGEGDIFRRHSGPPKKKRRKMKSGGDELRAQLSLSRNVPNPNCTKKLGGNWSGVDALLSLRPHLPHGLHCHLSSLCALSAIGLVHGPLGSQSLPPRLGSGLWARGFWALPPGHTVHWRLSLGRGVHSVLGGGGVRDLSAMERLETERQTNM